MDAALRAAAEAGNVDDLYTSIKGNPRLLDQIDNEPFVETPLHLAASRGHTQFAMEIMGLRPSFARKLDLNGFTPLHLALQNDKTDTVDRLVGVESDLVRVRGREGSTPLHIVAEKGKLELLKKFLTVCLESIQDVTIRGETALHLAVKKQQFEAFKLLVKALRRAMVNRYDFLKKRSILNWTDVEGNSLLHIAALTNQPKVVPLLLYYRVNVDAKNSEELTALQIAKKQTAADHITVKELLQNHWKVYFLTAFNEFMLQIQSNNYMTEERRNALLIVSTLIITATYQAALSPPGGLWQDDGNTFNNTASSSTFNQTLNKNTSTFNTTHPIREETSLHIAGRVIMNKLDFSYFWALNTLTLYFTLCCTCLALPDFNFFVGLYVYMPLVLLLLCYASAMSAISGDVIGGVRVLSVLPVLSILMIILGKIKNKLRI